MLKLFSDFVDFYDSSFAYEGEPFYRRSTGGPNRIEMLNMMSAVGLEVPKHGYVKDLYLDMSKQFTSKRKFAKYAAVLELVVYTDLTAHRGEGKLKMSLRQAHKKYPEMYATQYLPCKNNESETLRCQVIGDDVNWMVFHSDDEWRSNCGDVDISPVNGLDELYPKMENICLPFYAIDFVSPYGRHGANDLIAIDLNVAPRLKGTPIEKYYTPVEIVKLITKKHREINGLS